jgi:hypothetical protein
VRARGVRGAGRSALALSRRPRRLSHTRAPRTALIPRFLPGRYARAARDPTLGISSWHRIRCATPGRWCNGRWAEFLLYDTVTFNNTQHDGFTANSVPCVVRSTAAASWCSLGRRTVHRPSWVDWEACFQGGTFYVTCKLLLKSAPWYVANMSLPADQQMDSNVLAAPAEYPVGLSYHVSGACARVHAGPCIVQAQARVLLLLLAPWP